MKAIVLSKKKLHEVLIKQGFTKDEFGYEKGRIGDDDRGCVCLSMIELCGKEIEIKEVKYQTYHYQQINTVEDKRFYWHKDWFVPRSFTFKEVK